YHDAPLQAGTNAVARNNVILGGKRMLVGKSSEPQSDAIWGIQLETLGQGHVTLDGNIVANRKESGNNAGIFQYSGVTYTNNIQYNWGGGIGDSTEGSSGPWKEP